MIDEAHTHENEGDSKRQVPIENDPNLDMISAHVEAHIGPIEMVFHELRSPDVHLDVLQVAPTKDRPFRTFVTCGMCDLPMTVPPGLEEWAYGELLLCLPADWLVSMKAFKNERHYWPIRWLKTVARLPHEQKTWIGMGHTVPNGQPPEPFAPGVPFDCMFVSVPRTTVPDFFELKVREDKIIHFFGLFPLYPGETKLKLAKGGRYLDDLFDDFDITELVELRRGDVSRSTPE